MSAPGRTSDAGDRIAPYDGAPLGAVARIERSRARLREALMPQPDLPDTTGHAHDGSWLQRLEGVPVVGVVVESVRGWWAQHPWRTIGVVAGEASNAVARPLAQRHPVALVLAAALVGAVLVWRRPWGRLIRPALFAGLVPQIVSRVVAKLPVDAWMNVLDSALSGRPSAADPGAASASFAKTSATA